MYKIVKKYFPFLGDYSFHLLKIHKFLWWHYEEEIEWTVFKRTALNWSQHFKIDMP